MNAKRALKIAAFVVPLLALVPLAMLGVLTLLDTGGSFTANSQLSKDQQAAIQAQVPLEADEKILFLYEMQTDSPNAGFYVFTDQRIGCYVPDDDRDSCSFDYRDISELEWERTDSWLVDSQVFVRLQSGDEFWIAVNSLTGGLERAMQVTKRAWTQRRKRS